MSNYPRALTLPKRSFFLFGARGTGKSTLVRESFSNALQINLLDESLYQEYLRDIGLFARHLDANPQKNWVIVDEIQRLPQLLNEVHRFIEEKGRQFVLLGSSSRKLKTHGTNLLAGRASQRFLFPFIPSELGSDFDLNAILRYGSLPIVWSASDRKEVLEAYVQTYLKQEIQAESLVRNLPGFSRFLPVASLFHGQILNVSNVAREAGVARSTINGYLDILEDTLLAYRLPAFEAKLRVRERKHPKLYFIDPGVKRALQKSFHSPSPEEKGSLFEGWIGTLLKTHQHYFSFCDEIHYWAPTESERTEVDFVIEKGKELWGVEVKASLRLREDQLKGLNAFSEKHAKVKRKILVYLGQSKQMTRNGIEILPVQDFLELLDRER